MFALLKEVIEALQEANDHLEYCGYGDSWERECAIDGGLDKKIEAALEKGNKVLDEANV